MKFLLLLFLWLCAQQVFAGNPDILWQKTLGGDSSAIYGLAISEGKYVAAVLKRNEIVVFDYATGDSIRSFTPPDEFADPYRNRNITIILGHNGERLYLMNKRNLQSWDIATGTQLQDIEMIPSAAGYYYSYELNKSLDGRSIVLGISWGIDSFAKESSGGTVIVFNTEDSTLFRTDGDAPYRPDFTLIASNYDFWGGGLRSLSVSSSGNYIISNIENRNKQLYVSHQGSFTSLSPNRTTYRYKEFIPNYILSYDDYVVVRDSTLMDFPPVHTLRKITKTGSMFLPDGNHMFAPRAGGGVAAISNIERDTWEKVFYGDSLSENFFQVNASGTAFVTAAQNRITLWKIPTDVQPAQLTAGFEMSNSSIMMNDSVSFTNTTYPFKRGTHYTWDFGDGSPVSTLEFPGHRYKQSGTFTVLLSVQDTLGATSAISKTIVVDKLLRARFFMSKDTISAGDMIDFYNTSSQLGSGTQFTWKFDDEVVSQTAYLSSYRFTRSGIYTITLIATNSTLGMVDSTSRKLTVLSHIAPNFRMNSLVYSADGQMILSASDDGYACIWDGLSGKQQVAYQVGQPVYSALFTKDSKSAILASYLLSKNSPVYVKGSVATLEHFIGQWNILQQTTESKFSTAIETGIPIPTYLSFSNLSFGASMSEDNRWYLLRTGFQGTYSAPYHDPSIDTKDFGKILFYMPESGGTIGFKNLYTDAPITDALIFPTSQKYMVLQGNNLYVQDITILNNAAIDRQIPMNATSMRFSPDKYHLLTNTGLWDIYDSVLVQALTLPQVFVFHPDGIHVFTIRPDSTIGIFNLNSNSYDYLYPKQPRVFTCLAVAPDGKHIATGDNSGYITVWNVPDTLKSSIKIDFQALSFKRSAVKTSDTVEFANTTLPANNSFDYAWNFGDGTTSTERAPQHRYLKPGKFTVSLTAYSNGNVVDSLTKTQYITVTGPADADESQAGLSSTALSISPNPSYAETQIHITLAQASNYNVRIMDNLGREIARWDDHSSTGEHVILWNENVPSGVYYCMLSVGGEVRMVPFVVVR
ncbi:MAG: PKD domain-containing protein [Candidatus Kapaibacterium sp.]